MLNLTGYDLGEQLHHSERTLVFRAARKDGRQVAIKAPANPQPTELELARFGAEYQIGKDIEHQGIVRVLGLEKVGHRPALVLEDFGGQSLADTLSAGPLELEVFFELAIQLVEAIGELHQRGITHKDINPGNIIHNPETGQIKLTDLSIATVLKREDLRTVGPNVLEGTLRYMSPEQTGRMNRSVDYRTDFYSLGVTLYEMLVGRVPFDAKDPLELVHAHIARTPPSPALINPLVPEAISRVVMKLLAKTADDRYQSAAGLLADLRRCRQLGHEDSFSPGEQDATARFSIPEKLYGRQRELDRMTAVLDQAAEGSRQLLLITGGSGMGKSSLVNELQRLVVQRRGWFISGRFDSLRRDFPHSAFIDAARELIRHLLTGTEESLVAWRQRLQAALGSEGNVLKDAIPEMELVLGRYTESQAMSTAEEEQRFNRLVRQFFRAISTEQVPLVIFLDDLQWADPASLRLIELLLADDDMHYLLLIAAYRPEDVDATHPLSLTLRSLTEGPAQVDLIELGPLEVGDVIPLLADTLHHPPAEVEGLARLVREKTLGNPLFVEQFLLSLQAKALLLFDTDSGSWRWDSERIVEQRVAESVVELLLEKLIKLPESTRGLLHLASCMGNRFDLGLLTILSGQSVLEVVRALRPAMDEGVIRTICPGYGRVVTWSESDCDCTPQQVMGVFGEFNHDRIHQAVYDRIPEQKRREVHLQLGRWLRSSLDGRALEERLFEVVNHFHVAGVELMEPGERRAIAELNHDAGIKARRAGARDAARKYFSQGIDLLPEDRWQSCHRLTFDLLVGLYDGILLDEREAERGLAIGEELLAHAATRIERMIALSLHVIQLSMRGRQPEHALELGLKALREAGIDLDPPDPGRVVAQGYKELSEKLAGRRIVDLVDHVTMTDPERMAVMELVKSLIGFPIFMRRRDLIPLAMLEGVRYSLEHGNSPVSGVSYAGWGMVVAHTFRDFEAGYQFGRLGVAVAEKMGINSTVTHTIAGASTDWLYDPLIRVLKRLREAFRTGVETGDATATSFAASTIATVGFAGGVHLSALRDECQPLAEFVVERLGDIGVREIHLTLRMIETLIGIRPWRAALFDTPAEAERAMTVAKKFNREAVQRYYLLQARLHYLLGEYHQALEMAGQSERWTDRRVGQTNAYELDFIHALSIAAVYPTAEPERKAGLWESLQLKLGILAGLVEAGAGANVRHQYLLLTAEVARISEDHRTASTTYERAIACASDSGLIHDQALANEVAARFYLGQGLERVARVYLEEARYCYNKWGAAAKAKHLEQHYPDLLVRGARPENVPARVTRTSSSQSEILDVATVLKASQVISSEMILGALLQKLLGSIIENTGAQRGFLVLRNRKELSVVAMADAESDEVTLIDSEPLQNSDRLSPGIVQYVARTRQDVVLDDAAREGMFQTDPYVAEKQPRSVLCAPLINQGSLVGVTYLENNLASGAFAEGRLQVVNLLGAQAAISIENARLYSELEQSNRKLTEHSKTLEQKVEERTRDLAERNAQLNASLKTQRRMQDQLLISEKMASLGNLVAGVAHEINNPVGAVASSADTARRVQDKLEQAIESADNIEELLASDRLKHLLSMLRENHEVMSTASQRVTRIVRTLRNFARLDEAERKLADLHEGIESTLTLVRHRLKDTITVKKEYGQIKPITCYPNQLNQVFMNLLINAVDAIEEGSNAQRQITIRTWMDQDWVHVQIADTGAGVPEQLQSKIFDPGFTTKGVGVGTGLGLPICFNIVQNHKGSLSFESQPGRGTTFTMSLPVGLPS